jgi:preprotein translocase subunit SecG
MAEPMFIKVLACVFILVCIALTVIVLMQEGKSAGLTGAISGAAETYWGKNKGRSIEGRLVKTTKVLAVIFFVVAIVLNLNF